MCHKRPIARHTRLTCGSVDRFSEAVVAAMTSVMRANETAWPDSFSPLEAPFLALPFPAEAAQLLVTHRF